MHTVTHTYAILEVSQKAFEEIKKTLEKVGYDHVFNEDKTLIDMHGIALVSSKKKKP
jgi:hypothetical protein